MKDFLLKLAGGVVLAFALVFGAVQAQTVTKLPIFVAPNSVSDLGNGPTEILPLLGNAWVFTSQGTATGSTSGSSTTLTLTATPTTPPCIGCIVSGSGITLGTTVANYNNGLTVTLNAAMNISPSTLVSYGAACPSFASALTFAPMLGLSAGNTGYPFYTQARICGYAANGPGMQLLPFSIGAH